MKKRKSKILVAMSGGVDSSVAALILKQKRHDVHGCFMILTNNNEQQKVEKIAQKINIPFHCFDFRKQFEDKIVNNFIKGYKKEITPNPCVECNKQIKFGIFLEKAINLGFDYIATGHYVDLRKTNETSLLKGKDKNKDQSYFLWQLNQEQLQKCIFPLGKYNKKEVKEIAKKFKLPLADTKESQEICFVEKSTTDFLKKNIKKRKGDIVNSEGIKIGEHQGINFYTIGQRKGLNVSGGPYFIFKKDSKNNILFVTKNQKELFNKEILIDNINWISNQPVKMPLKVSAKIRYNQKLSAAQINSYENGYKITFTEEQKAITPGQSVVFYQKNKLLGGAIIIQ